MKKRIVSILLIFVIIVLALIIVKKVNKGKSDYDIVQIQSLKYFKYNENDKYGVIDREGNIILEADYTDIIIPNPEKDIFICHSDGVDKSTVLNSSKQELFTEYDNIEPIKLKSIASVLCYEKSTLKYEKDGLYGLIDFNGKEITKNIYSSIDNLQLTEGKFLVSKDNKYGVINVKGKVLVKPEYDQISTDDYYNNDTGYIDSGFIVSKTTDDGYRYGYYSPNGKKLLDTEFNEIKRISELDDIYIIASKDGQYGLYKNSKEIIAPNYQSINYEENGALILRKNANYGMANLNGDILIDTKYLNIKAIGIYVYAEGTKESKVYDIDGNEANINFNKTVYKTDNDNYRIFTIINNDVTYYGLENNKGETLINSNYEYLEYLYNDYFIAKDENDNLGVVDVNDKKIIDFKYDVIQKVKDKNVVQIIDMKKLETEIYSSNMENIVKMKKAVVENEDGYLVISNKSEKVYLDINGNKIDENSDVVKKVQNTKLPEAIGEYKKVQFSLEDAYYIKE